MNTIQGLKLREDALERLAEMFCATHDGGAGIAWPDGYEFTRKSPETQETFRGVAADVLAAITEPSMPDG